MAIDYEVFVTAGLGDNTFLVASGDEAVLVDPQRDAWRFVAAAERRGLRIRGVLETHVHNDYLSGAHEVRAATGADILAPAKGGYAFPHTPSEEGVEIAIGDLLLRAWDTPGHTYEHIAWAAFRPGDAGDATPLAVFSGGSLLVGSAGRTDLLGPDHTAALTDLQFATMARYRALPAAVDLLPTHGAGSFCVSTLPTAARVSTIGEELGRNAALTASDGATFAEQQLTGVLEYARYYAAMAPRNRTGPPVLGSTPRPPRLDGAAVAEHRRRGTVIVDARDRESFAAAHIPGALNVELNEGFCTYVGWVTPFDCEHVLVLPESDDAEREAIDQLIRIGYDRTVGILEGGMASWAGETRSYPIGTTKELRERLTDGEPTTVLDVRQPGEWESEGVVPGSIRIFVGDLPERLDELDPGAEHWIFCTNGHRASLAASLLDARGIRARLIAKSGVLGLLDHLEPLGAAR
ncbi:MAG: MBL fold metallo-hydrolase [Actinomycetota bacterium]